jgi:hypothetical protein
MSEHRSAVGPTENEADINNMATPCELVIGKLALS